jgi:hypothetical protein
MSLKDFVALPDVAARVKPLRPKLPRAIASPLKAPPRSNRHMMLGTAFDYLLRFELQRRAPHVVAREWVAERAPEIIWGQTDRRFFGLDPSPEAEPDFALYPEDVARRARKAVEEAKAAVAAYVASKAPEGAQQADLAAHAIRLAKLDGVYRAGRFDPRFEEASPEDVDDLLAMLRIAPFEALVHPRVVLLNPTFGESSLLVGGADADLITGDLLVDFKATKNRVMQGADLDQLLGYYLLARRHHQADPNFPVINRLALYFCRHGLLWVQDAALWASHPQFPEVEGWFFRRAEAVFHSEDAPRRGSPARTSGGT